MIKDNYKKKDQNQRTFPLHGCFEMVKAGDVFV